MQKKLFLAGMLAAALIFGIIFASCEPEPKPEQLDTPSITSIELYGANQNYWVMKWQGVSHTSKYRVAWDTASDAGTGSIIETALKKNFYESDFYEWRMRVNNNPIRYYFKVQAVGDGKEYTDSDWSRIESKYISFDDY